MTLRLLMVSSVYEQTNVHRITLQVQYKTLKWLGLIFRYAYAQRDSTFSTLEFYANTIGVGFQGAF